jgi:ribosomal protein S18 acetylase RimI-like enzyme
MPRVSGVTIDWYDGPREELRPMFELAEDSEQQLAGYLHLGRVLVARQAGVVVGHLQLIPTDEPGTVELKSMAVVDDLRAQGIGRALIDEAVRRSAAEGKTRMTVSTAAADVAALRFYQRTGFWMFAVERDAFTPATGYPDPIEIDGIQLRDRVWFDRHLPRPATG